MVDENIQNEIYRQEAINQDWSHTYRNVRFGFEPYSVSPSVVLPILLCMFFTGHKDLIFLAMWVAVDVLSNAKGFPAYDFIMRGKVKLRAMMFGKNRCPKKSLKDQIKLLGDRHV